ncbi:hypothetical protein, partial [Acinetobacter indicus]|uniref:hypothetical protein n=1 Tax=Acinetobacter indicus TaxID=756892 RepID=UPI001C092034
MERPKGYTCFERSGTIIRTRNITYKVDMVEEFEKQIPELLRKCLIRDSYNAHSSPAFMVINHAEKVRGKARM